MKVFYGGIGAAGKSTAARAFAGKAGISYVDYDVIYGWRNLSPAHAREFLDSLPGDCAVDCIPQDPTWATFNDWAAERDDVAVNIMVVTKDEWRQRASRDYYEKTDELWRRFWVDVFPTGRFPRLYVGPDGATMTHKEAMQVAGMRGLLEARLRGPTAQYDYKYQSIPEVGHLGYSGVEESWATIEGLADWGRASVVDCGCFHGYMLFRISDAEGAGRLIGLDSASDHLTTARCVNALRGDTVEFRQWQAGEPLPAADVTLCTNSLHWFEAPPAHYHVKRSCPPARFLETIRSPVAIFEVDKSYRPLLDGAFGTVEEFPSARPGRAIYRCKR